MHDSGDDGYQFNSSEAVDLTNRPLLTVSFVPSAATNPVSIITQPAASTTIDEGQNFTLSVVADGTLPAFQWYKGSDPIPGAQGASFTVTGANETNSGTYFVVVTNFYPSTVTSAAAVVTVNPDTNGPALVSALGTSPTTIVLTFNQALAGSSVSNLLHYTLAPAYGGAALTMVDAALAANGTTVTLTTAARDTWTYYLLTVQNLTDTAYRLNPLVPNPTSLVLPYQVAVLSASSTWKYHDLGNDLGTAWTTATYDDESWMSTNALFWATRFNAAINPADADVAPGGQLAWTNAVGNTNITYYYRSTFAMPAVAAGVKAWSLRMHGVIDDGVVVYFNGQEATRVRMPTNEVTWSTFGTGNGSNYRYDATTYALPTTNVTMGGQNLVAVELHQVNLTSSDAAFAAEFYVDVPALVMEVTIARSGSTVTLDWPPVTGYRLYAADAVNGPYTPVLSGGNPVAPPYAVPAPLAAKKFYQLQNP
jgi:hypothetical protein